MLESSFGAFQKHLCRELVWKWSSQNSNGHLEDASVAGSCACSAMVLLVEHGVTVLNLSDFQSRLPRKYLG